MCDEIRVIIKDLFVLRKICNVLCIFDKDWVKYRKLLDKYFILIVER